MTGPADDDPMGSAGDAPAGGRYRILLVDDDPTMLMVMEAMLSAKMDVATCTSGLQAMMVLRRQTFDVVCSDYVMPGMDGIAVLRAAAEAQQDASFLLVTGGADLLPEVARKRYYVLQKPFRPERLVGLVAQLARIAHMKRSVKASASKITALSERPSAPPPSTPRSSEAPPRRSEAPPRRSEAPPRRSEAPPSQGMPRPGPRGRRT